MLFENYFYMNVGYFAQPSPETIFATVLNVEVNKFVTFLQWGSPLDFPTFAAQKVKPIFC
jgi:hypothetical protein